MTRLFAAAIVAAGIAASPVCAQEARIAVLTVVLDAGQVATFTRNFSQPVELVGAFSDIGIYDGDSVVIRFRDSGPCDIDGDGKVGLAEAIHALQVASGLRPEN